MKSIYVGNLPYSTTNEQMVELFGQFGAVSSVKLINDRETGRTKCFGYVALEDEEALKAISALDGTEFIGRKLRVNEANPRKM